jgi:hypothetical protein
MIYYILAYMVLGMSTAILVFGREMSKRDRIITFLVWFGIWPIIWLQIAVIYLRGKNVEKCAWCGKSVAPYMNLKSAINSEPNQKLAEIWREHYLNDCDKHPLAIKCKRLEKYLDETDARFTALRVNQERLAAEAARVSEANDRLEAEVAPLREMMTAIKKRALRNMDHQILKGDEP